MRFEFDAKRSDELQFQEPLYTTTAGNIFFFKFIRKESQRPILWSNFKHLIRMKWFEIDNCNRNTHTHTHTTYAYVKHQCFTHSFVIYVCSLSTCDSWQAAISCHMFSLAVYVQKMYAVLAQIAGKQASKPLDKYTAIDVRSSDLFYNWFINLPSVAISNG